MMTEATDSVKPLGEKPLSSKAQLRNPNSLANLNKPVSTKEEARALVAKSNEVQREARLAELMPKRAQLREEIRKYTNVAVAALVDVAMNSKNAAARVNAAESLLDRGYGRNRIAAEEKNDTATKIQVVFGDGHSPSTTTIDAVPLARDLDEETEYDNEAD